MKKLVFVGVLVLIGWLLYRTLGVKQQTAANGDQSVPAATHPVHREELVSGAKLDSVFPSSDADYKVAVIQATIGYTEAGVSKGGVKVAALSVSDTEANPGSRDKFYLSKKKIGRFPATPNGSQGTAVLVANRYLVQVRSLTPAFTEADREAWLQKFKLAQLAVMK